MKNLLEARVRVSVSAKAFALLFGTVLSGTVLVGTVLVGTALFLALLFVGTVVYLSGD